MSSSTFQTVRNFVTSWLVKRSLDSVRRSGIYSTPSSLEMRKFINAYRIVQKVKFSLRSRCYAQACGGTNLCGLAPEQHSSEETPQHWRAVDDFAFDLTVPRIELQPPASLAVSLISTPTCGLMNNCAYMVERQH